MDIRAERVQITKFDPEEAEYCSKLLDEIEQLQTELDVVNSKLSDLDEDGWYGDLLKDRERQNERLRKAIQGAQCCLCIPLGQETGQRKSSPVQSSTGAVLGLGRP